MKNLLKIGTSSLVLVGAAMSPAFANDPMTESLRGLRGEEFDKKFLSHMIDHHKQGVEMAELARHHAQSSGVKQFAAKSAQSQQKEIEEIMRMKGDKSSHQVSGSDPKPRVEETRPTGSSHASSSHTSGTSHEGAGAPTGRTSHESSTSSHHASSGSHKQMKQETMSKLESAQGAQFDQVFVDEMLKHHEMGKEMAQLAQQQSSRDDVRSFAAKAVKQQDKESEELKRFKGTTSR